MRFRRLLALFAGRRILTDADIKEALVRAAGSRPSSQGDAKTLSEAAAIYRELQAKRKASRRS